MYLPEALGHPGVEGFRLKKGLVGFREGGGASEIALSLGRLIDDDGGIRPVSGPEVVCRRLVYPDLEKVTADHSYNGVGKVSLRIGAFGEGNEDVRFPGAGGKELSRC